MAELMNVHPQAIENLCNGENGAPFDILGVHEMDAERVSVRAFRPHATQLVLIERSAGGTRHRMERVDPRGLFVVELETTRDDLSYELEETHADGTTLTFRDAYAFIAPYVTDYDRYLLGEGRHFHAYEKLGAHVYEVYGVKGVNFAVWAPNAVRVSVVGDFNNWDSRIHVMRQHATNGIWELFIPGVDVGAIYKYEIRSYNQSYTAEKIDPYGFQFEMRPRTGTIVADIDQYEWGDQDWMGQRAETNWLEAPMSVYEVHLGSWKRKERNDYLTYRELAEELVPYVRDMGYTHIELMPVAEHPFDGSWGYQVTGYYAPTSRFGSPDDFMYFVDQCHQNGIGVIVDWVPAHFPKDGHALSYFDGTHLFSHEDPRRGEQPDWGTYIFNFGRNEVRNFLTANALFWLDKYHIDGLRVDAVSSMIYLNFSREEGEWIPNEYGGHENLEALAFLREFNELAHKYYPGAVTIAEESTSWPMVSRPTYIGGLGFTFKWNMGWMHDTLGYMQKDPIYRRYMHNQVTFSLLYAFTENFVLSLSHDEVVHGKGSLMGKMAGDVWQKFANLRLLYGYQYTHPGKKLNFMGSEIAQWQEWSEARSLDWHLLDWPNHSQVQKWIHDLNAFYVSQPALYEQDFVEEGFRWIEPNDADNSVYSYIRFAKDPDDFIVVAANFTPVPREGYRLGVPRMGSYKEMLNSDSMYYGGSNVGNGVGLQADPYPLHGYDQSISVTLPPLGIVVLKLIEK